VIAADTIVVLEEHILGKPADMAEAKWMLGQLSGHVHQVYSGVSLQWQDKNIHHSFTEITDVRFNEISPEDITYYIDHYGPYDKAGAYAIQEWAATFVAGIEGCYYNVMGFPLSRFYRELKEVSIELSFQPKLTNS